ncbi:uncharacterized protein LOC121729980 [Aricia agestis]|uniref:uncharacterized protein LOC121729980 n=1 Tax=Aricia agestis TaxID=91739 RepID=UPI001C20808C|nr:uncharacterized protein LOC121729980 [Aricia agestis]
MSDEMAIGDKTSNSEQMPDHKEAIGDSNDSLYDADCAAAGSIDSSEGDQNPTAGALKKGRKDSLTDEISEKLKAMEKDDPSDIKMDTLENTNEERSNKRRASAAFSDDGDEEFKGFGQDEPIVIPDYNRIVDDVEVAPRRNSISSDVLEEFKGFEISDQKNLTGYNQILERLEAELSEDVKSFTPLKTVLTAPLIKASKRARQDTDSSRPSSALSSRSEGEGVTDVSQGILQVSSNFQFLKVRNCFEINNSVASMSPANRGRRTDVSSPLLRLPLERGWRRELVYRAALDAHSRRAADIYYYMPSGKKLRSMREISEVLGGTGLTTENFSFFKEPLGIDDPEKEIIRDAKMMRRVESPVPQPPLTTDGKRTPKPKPPKGASPEPTPKSPPAKIKVKSMGSRLSNSGTPTGKPARKTQPTPPPAPAQPDNNNSAAWKKPSEARGRLANGAALSPRRRGRARVADAPPPGPPQDLFTDFCRTAKQHKYDVGMQIFQYLGMRDLSRAARVCRQWRELAAAPALWRHVRMKNSHVYDWGGLCKALKKHGTKWLDLRKMLLPSNDVQFWDQFAEHIATADTLERLELCRCPARAVEAACSLLGLRSLAAPAVRDTRLDPGPLARLTRLERLRIKSMTGLSLTRDLRPLAELRALQHLSLTSIKELGWCACEVVGQLERLESLELGECSFGGDFAPALSRLHRLRRVRLERGVPHAAAPALLRALADLPALDTLELVNFDVKVGFDDALAECKNIQRLLIIPTYVSQSATTNKQVLSGVLRLKETLTHLMWGVTIELLRVTELFIDQCEAGGGDGDETKRRDVGECIPVLKPVPGCRLPDDHRTVAGPPQVEILPIPTLQRLLSAQLPRTKLKLLRIPFHATWRQTLADFQ